MWNSTGITFANDTIAGSLPNNIFIDVTNAIYVSSQNLDLVQIWSGGNSIPRRNLSGYLNNASGLFVTANGEIYVGNGTNGRVVKWGLNTTNSTLVMNAPSSCVSLFVDINNTLYCSMESGHKIVKNFLDNNNTNTSLQMAGNGIPGSSPNMLHSPKGIFVSTSFQLYVADCGNNRIQLFQFGNTNATTVAGNGSSGSTILNCPTGIILDADGYLFIADGNNHRIIGSGPDGFGCVVGCSTSAGSGSDQLNYPQNLAFDSLGNLFVVDKNNGRIQQFILATRSCSKYS